MYAVHTNLICYSCGLLAPILVGFASEFLFLAAKLCREEDRGSTTQRGARWREGKSFHWVGGGTNGVLD